MWIKEKWDVTSGNGNWSNCSHAIERPVAYEIQSSTEIEFGNVTVDDMPYINNKIL